MTSTHRYRYALVGLALLGLLVAMLPSRHSSTEVATVDEPTTTTADVPSTTTTTTVPETTTVATTVAPPATVVVEPTTVVPVVPDTEAAPVAPAAPEASAAVVADALPTDEQQPAPAVRVETKCMSDPAICNPPTTAAEPWAPYVGAYPCKGGGSTPCCTEYWQMALDVGWSPDNVPLYVSQ